MSATPHSAEHVSHERRNGLRVGFAGSQKSVQPGFSLRAALSMLEAVVHAARYKTENCALYAPARGEFRARYAHD